MKKTILSLMVSLCAVAVMAQGNGHNDQELAPAKEFHVQGFAKPGGGGAQNLTYHNGGVVIRNAKVVFIFWGPSFGPAGADNAYATQIQLFRNQFGTTGEYNTITQYSGADPVSGFGNIALANLAGGTADWFDSSVPPTNVTDALVRSKVQQYLTTHATDYSTVYEVVLPPGTFSSDGSQGSCGATGGVTLAYCAYHWNYTDGAGKQVKYSIEPYPSCSGCQVSGWTAAQNQEHFVCHETREAVTDALGNAWYDRRGNEADDKCAWSPAPFIGTGGFGYQYEWSNADSGCVKTK